MVGIKGSDMVDNLLFVARFRITQGQHVLHAGDQLKVRYSRFGKNALDTAHSLPNKVVEAQGRSGNSQEGMEVCTAEIEIYDHDLFSPLAQGDSEVGRYKALTD